MKKDKPVPIKRKRTPKKVKEAIKLLDQLNKLSKGDELLSKLDKDKKEDSKKKVSENPKEKKKDKDYVGTIRDGVEVVDVKAVPIKVDKFGIPVPPNRKNWDKI